MNSQYALELSMYLRKNFPIDRAETLVINPRNAVSRIDIDGIVITVGTISETEVVVHVDYATYYAWLDPHLVIRSGGQFDISNRLPDQFGEIVGRVIHAALAVNDVLKARANDMYEVA